ncbi:tripartite tricarboxylate transporter TctB family protein [Thermodesulfobacteriota bacterium]
MKELKNGLFFFGLSVFVLWESLRLELGTLKEPGPGFISFCTAVIMSLLSLALIFSSWKVRAARLPPLPRRAVLAFAVLIAYSLVLDTLGFVVASFVLVGIFFRLGGEKRPWWVLIGMSMLVTMIAYWVFGVLLHVYLPRGFWGI